MDAVTASIVAKMALVAAGHLSRQFKLAYGESPYGYLMTRRIERAMALLRRGGVAPLSWTRWLCGGCR
jgi:transcriptional regulator GlxA family with amidase domain